VRRLGVKVSELSEMKGQSNIDSYFWIIYEHIILESLQKN
jgi:hypothetical protein